MATHSKRRAANPGALTKSITYANGIFSATTDIRALVEAFGVERVTAIAYAMDKELNKLRSKRAPATARKIAAKQDAVIKDQLSIHVASTIARYKLKKAA